MTDQINDPAGCPDTDCPCDRTEEFKAVFAESVSFLDAPQSAGVANGLLAVQATSSLVDALLELAKALGTQLAAYLPQLKVAALAVYDTKIAPLDIAFVPNTVEPMVDALLRGLLEQGLDALIAAQPTWAAAKASSVAKIEELRSTLPA